SIVWGKEQEMGRKGRSISLIGEAQGNKYVFAVEGADHFIEIHRESKSISTIPIEMPEIDGNKMDFVKLLIADKGLLLITKGSLKSENVKVAYGTPISFDGTPTDLPVLLDEIALGKSRNKVVFGFEMSPSKQLLLVYHDSPFQKKSNDRLKFKVYDTSLGLLWEKELQLPYEEEVFELAEYSIDNIGRVYMLSGMGQEMENNLRLDMSARDARSVLVTYDPVANKLKEFDVGLKDKWVMSIGIDFAANNDAVISGFYSKDQLNTVGGTFYFRISSKENAMVAGGLSPFPDEFLSEFSSNRRAERASELDRFRLKEMLVDSIGKVILIGEQHYVNERITTDMGNGRQRITYDYIYNDLVAIQLDEKGKITWNARIPKEQMSVDDNGPYSSFAVANSNGKLILLFNDHPGNTELLAENSKVRLKPFRSFGKSVITMVELDSTGNMTRRTLSDSKVGNSIFKPKLFSLINNGVWLYADYRRDYRFGELLIN
ncbi:MAG: hypothetical protein ACPGED_09085, partial [Flavobacteriales bacterium]